MDALMVVLIMSGIIWYLIDRGKDGIWGKYDWGKYVTIAVSAVLSAAVVFCFHLDLIAALGVVDASSIMGQILTVLVLMSGSSGVSEIIQRVRGEKKAEN